jgi:hypothetical protein
MTIGNVSIILILGIVNGLLILFQLLTGLRLIKVSFTLHRKTGILLVITAFLHGALAFLANTL